MAECPFCGAHFIPEEAKNVCGPCIGCLGARFETLKGECPVACPHCGYAVFVSGAERAQNNVLETQNSAEVTQKSASLASSCVVASLSPLPLSQCPLGQSLRVVAIDTDESNLRKLLTLGILPGMQLKLERRRPCFLLKVGRACLALDEKLAACILVVFCVSPQNSLK